MTQKRKQLGKLVTVVSNSLKSGVAGSDTVILLALPSDAVLKEVTEGELYDLMLAAPKIVNVTFHHYPHNGEKALAIKVLDGSS